MPTPMFRTLVIALILVVLPVTVSAEEAGQAVQRRGAEAMAFDGLVRRPIGLLGTALGTGLFIVTLPFSALGGNADEARETLVVEPARDTFSRCLGCWED